MTKSEFIVLECKIKHAISTFIDINDEWNGK